MSSVPSEVQLYVNVLPSDETWPFLTISSDKPSVGWPLLEVELKDFFESTVICVDGTLIYDLFDELTDSMGYFDFAHEKNVMIF